MKQPIVSHGIKLSIPCALVARSRKRRREAMTMEEVLICVL